MSVLSTLVRWFVFRLVKLVILYLCLCYTMYAIAIAIAHAPAPAPSCAPPGAVPAAGLRGIYLFIYI